MKKKEKYKEERIKKYNLTLLTNFKFRSLKSHGILFEAFGNKI